MSPKARDHFKEVDQKLFSYIEKISLDDLTRSKDYFSELCDTIISQQLSGKAAATIFNRFKNLFPKKKISAIKLLKLSEDKIRSCGRHGQKSEALRTLRKR